ncbi:MAG: hypothetical protein BVN35_06145 [Proteobacteria bacterium ST_bin11]|nr:MAG: hypothetical protein BVN35_06145 [Proteobacteria bacterium ST_bin11]
MHALHIAPWIVGFSVSWLISVWAYFGLSVQQFYGRLQLPPFSAPRLFHALFTTIFMALQATACVLVNTNLLAWNNCLVGQVVSLVAFTLGNFLFFKLQLISSVVVALMAISSGFQVWSWLACINIGEDEASWLMFFPMIWSLYLSIFHFVVWVKNRRLLKQRDVEAFKDSERETVNE